MICTLGRVTLGLLVAGGLYAIAAVIAIGLTETAQGGPHIEDP